MSAKEQLYRLEKGLGYLPIEENELEKFVPELGVVLDLACMEMAELHGCPETNQHPEYEYKGSCAKNCTAKNEQERECWKAYFKQKAKEIS